MMERFDFYDVYGYLAPGAILLLLACFPFALTDPAWKLPDAGEVLIYGVVAYVAGYFLQHIAEPFISEECEQDRRYPHSTALDVGNPDLSERFQDIVRGEVASRFAIALDSSYMQREFANEAAALKKLKPGSDTRKKAKEELDVKRLAFEGRRRDAFLLCRGAVLQSGRTTYVQQFQGRYALFRGVGTAALLCGCFYFGWAADGLLELNQQFVPTSLAGSGIVGLLALLVITSLVRWDAQRARNGKKPPFLAKALWRLRHWTTPSPRRDHKRVATLIAAQRSYLLLIPTVFFSGMVAAAHRTTPVTRDRVLLFLCAFFASWWIYVLCLKAHRYFARQFAFGVYRDFVTLMTSKPGEAPSKP